MDLQPGGDEACDLSVTVGADGIDSPPLDLAVSSPDGRLAAAATYRLAPAEDPASSRRQVYLLGTAVGFWIQARGGVLLHGALAERDGAGVLLAGRGGAGKSTAASRLPRPWRSLCDDTTLVVRDAAGSFWAHPWPTWSRLLRNRRGGHCEVMHAVPLKGIFFLEQAPRDTVDPVRKAQTACILLDLAEQVSRVMVLELEQKQVDKTRVARLDTVCSLAQSVPAYRMQVSLKGAFWREIERTLLMSREGETQ
jgi:SynChlorMet cassette protein ScmC